MSLPDFTKLWTTVSGLESLSCSKFEPGPHLERAEIRARVALRDQRGAATLDEVVASSLRRRTIFDGNFDRVVRS